MLGIVHFEGFEELDLELDGGILVARWILACWPFRLYVFNELHLLFDFLDDLRALVLHLVELSGPFLVFGFQRFILCLLRRSLSLTARQQSIVSRIFWSRILRAASSSDSVSPTDLTAAEVVATSGEHCISAWFATGAVSYAF